MFVIYLQQGSSEPSVYKPLGPVVFDFCTILNEFGVKDGEQKVEASCVTPAVCLYGFHPPPQQALRGEWLYIILNTVWEFTKCMLIN